MPTEVTIRAARPADADAIAALQSLPGVRFGTLRLPHPSPEDVRAWLLTMSDTNRELVGCVGDEVIAMGGLRRFAGRRSHVGAIGLAVHDAWIGRGIGSKMLAALIDRAENWLGLTRIELTVYADNVPAIALYRKFQFEIEGTHRRDALRDGVHVDSYVMARLRG